MIINKKYKWELHRRKYIVSLFLDKICNIFPIEAGLAKEECGEVFFGGTNGAEHLTTMFFY